MPRELEFLNNEEAIDIFLKKRYGEFIVCKRSKIEKNRFHVFDVTGDPVRIALGNFEETEYFQEEEINGELVQIPRREIHFIELDFEKPQKKKASY